MKAWLDKQPLEFNPDEKEQFLAASQKLSIQYQNTRDDRVYELRCLKSAVNGLAKLGGTFTADLTAGEKSSLEAMLDDPDRHKSLPVEKLKAWLKREDVEFTQKEKKGLGKALEELSERHDAAVNLLYNKAEYGYLRDASAGLEKLAGVLRATPSKTEQSALSGALDSDYQQKLPADKLKAWLGGGEVAFAENEIADLLAAADDFLRRYESARVRLGETVVRFVKQMRDAGTRFITYEVYEDKEKREKAGVFELIFALWKKIDDKVMIVDMVEISGTRNERLRETMEEALVAIGQPAVPTLIRNIRREKIDQALAAATKDRTKDERLRELNEANKIVRLSCIRALGRIGGTEAEEALKPLVDDEDTDIARAAADALARMQ